MTRKQVDALIVGGGPAGLAAAIQLHKQGITNIAVLEREAHPGGILRQCIHDGFGLTRFRESLSGPEYAQRFLDEAQRLGIPVLTGTTVLSIDRDKRATTVSRRGIELWQAKSIVLAMGCRERTRGGLAIPGERPAGVFTAGVAQAYINLYNTMVGKEVIILGSGDIGLIMARRLTLEGAHVKGVFELLPYASGLGRNVQQCLEDYGIPLHVSHTVTEIHGGSRITGVTVSRVDEQLRPIPGTGQFHSCDTLILSVGLIPENELSQDAGIVLDTRTRGARVDEYCQTSVPGIFAAGNALHVHDLVDFVSLEAEQMAAWAARYIREGDLPNCPVPITAGDGVGHTVPHAASGRNTFPLSLRVSRPYKNCQIVIKQAGKPIHSLELKRAVPAEMIQTTIPSGIIHPGKGQLEVCVQC